MIRPIVSFEGQGASFVELFFDLVFVFGLTQLVAFLHHDLTWVGAGKATLIFWMVWWAWTQFTWALNSADATHPFVELATLGATAIAFFMAVAIPEAFGSGSRWFAVTYVLVRVVGLILYTRVASTHPQQRAAVRNFALLSTGVQSSEARGSPRSSLLSDPLAWWSSGFMSTKVNQPRNISSQL